MTGPGPCLLLVTHGEVGGAMLATVEKILGPQQDVITVSNAGLSMRELVEHVQEKLRETAGARGTVLVVDMACGSCWNAARMAAREARDIALLAGMNLSMLLSFFNKRHQMPITELVEVMRQAARSGIDGHMQE